MSIRIARRALLASGLLLAGPRAAAAAEPPPVEAYGRLPAITDVTLSPSGERLAFVATDGEGRKLFVRTVAGKPLAVMPLENARLRDVYWAGERFVIFTLTVTRKLNPDYPPVVLMMAYKIDLETGENGLVFGKTVRTWDAVFGQYGVVQVGGRWLAIFSTLELTRSLQRGQMLPADYAADLFSVDLESADVTLLNRGDTVTSDWLLDGDRVAARQAYDDRTGAWKVTAGTGAQVLASGQDMFAEAGLIGLGRTRDTFLLSTWPETGRRGVREVSLADGSPGETIAPDLDLLSVSFDRATRQMIGYTVAGDQRRTVLFDPAQQAVLDKIGRAFAGKRPWVVSSSTARDRLVLFTEGAGDAGSYWLVDVKALKIDPLGEAYPRIPAAAIGASRRFAYTAGDGLALDGVLTLPPGREPRGLPVVVMINGGPGGRSELDFDWRAQAFAARGYAVFQPNARGASGYGKAFRDRGFGEWGRKMQTDVSDGLAALAAAGVVDPKRACIAGWGYGGYAALAGVTIQQGLYRCAVAGAPISDPQTMLNTEAIYAGGRNANTRYWRAYMGADRPGADLSAISPVKQASRADAPVLLIHGVDDSAIQADQSRAMERALKRAGKPVELLLLDGEDHWLSGETTRVAMLRASLDFVMTHNPPG
ncbi:MAG: alpha/beta hydrolase family protein [Pseudomonadota bacterium]